MCRLQVIGFFVSKLVFVRWLILYDVGSSRALSSMR